MKMRFFAALSAIACASLLGGCSLFDTDTDPANVYLPGDIVNAARPVNSTSSESGWGGQYTPPTNTSSSAASSSAPRPTVTTPEETEPVEPIDYYYGKWYYNHINDRQRAIYRRLYNCVSDNGEGIDISDLEAAEQDVFKAYWAFDYDNPQFPALGDGYEFTYVDHRVSNHVKSVKISYGRESGELRQTEFDTRAAAVIEAASALSSDYEKLKYVHDWIVDNTVYTNTGAPYESEADGPIVYGQALCEGYSKAFMYFAQSLGFPCICVTGTSRLEPHMWNMVKLGGSWYNVDVTWDDPVSADGSQTLRHDYFLLNDAEFRLDHRVEHPLLQPNAPDGYFPYGYSQDGDTDNGDTVGNANSGGAITIT